MHVRGPLARLPPADALRPLADGSGVVACAPGGLAFLSDQPLLEADCAQA